MSSKRIPALKVVLPLIAGSALFAAGTTIIGVASSQDSLTLDNSKVSGNATLFDGSTVTSSGFSRLQLKNGTRMDLSAGSQAKIYANSASLDRGMSEVQSTSGFEIDVNTLRIRTAEVGSIARVKVADKAVMVTALNAPVDVLNPAGLLIARVTPGLPLSFMPQAAGASAAFDGTGCVLNKMGVAVLVTDPGNQTYQLTNISNVKKLIGNKAHIVGALDTSVTPAAGATGVIKATKVDQTAKGGCDKVAVAIGASTAAAGLAAAGAAAAAGGAAAAAGGVAAAGVAAGVGIGTTALVVGGVAAAAAASVGGAAAAGAFSTPSPE